MRYGPWIGAGLLLLAATGVQAAIAWTSVGTLTTGVMDPTLRFTSGTGAEKSRFVQGLQVSANGTSFRGTLAAYSGAEAKTPDVVRITNLRDVPVTLNLTGTSMSGTSIVAFTWSVMDGGTRVTTLDHKAATPRTSITLPAGATYQLDLRIVMGSNTHTGAAQPFSVHVEAPP